MDADEAENSIRLKLVSNFNCLMQQLKLRQNFELISSSGPAHLPSFEYKLTLHDTEGNLINETTGEGSSKRIAKYMAVRSLYAKICKQPLPEIPKHINPTHTQKTTFSGNAVGFLQEYCMKNDIDPPVYESVPADVVTQFAFKCTLVGIYAIGQGNSKKEAKHNAARLAFKEYENRQQLAQSKLAPEFVQSFQSILADASEAAQNQSLPTASAAATTATPFSDLDELDFKNDGIEVLSGIINERSTAKLHDNFMRTIVYYAKNVGCEIDEYLKVVNYWEPPSKLCQYLQQWSTSLYPTLKQRFIQELECVKATVICANDMSIPCHQDISYTQDAKHEFSLLIPLYSFDTCDDNNGFGELLFEFLPSRCADLKASPPIDFHKMNFYDEIRDSSEWRNNAVLISVQSCHGVLFDSRLWYRFEMEETNKRVLLIQTNWRRRYFDFTEDYFCDIDPVFTSWTDKNMIVDILKQGLFHCFHLVAPANFKECVRSWKIALKDEVKEKNAISIDRVRVQQVLDKLWLQILGKEYHGGGDYFGSMFRRLWTYLLIPITNKVQIKFNDEP